MPPATDNYGNNDKRRQQPQQLATAAKADDNYGDDTNPCLRQHWVANVHQQWRAPATRGGGDNNT